MTEKRLNEIRTTVERWWAMEGEVETLLDVSKELLAEIECLREEVAINNRGLKEIIGIAESLELRQP